MAISTSTTAEKHIIYVKGRFDFSVQADFRKAYEGTSLDHHFVVDFTQADYIDSSALGMLLIARDYVGGDNAKMDLINCCPEIKNILEISNFQKLFSIS